jgi:N4-gp56 family major capsid protein
MMGDFTTNLTKAATVDDSLIDLWNQGVIIAAQENLVMDQFATVKEEFKAKVMNFTKYTNLTLATTPLTDGEDPVSTALADAPVTLTPAEHGIVVTTTKLSNLQTGGKVDRAAIQLIGNNMGQTQDKLAILALEAGANELTIGGGAESGLTASNIITTAYLEKTYNKLRRANIPMIGGSYVAIMHPDVISDLRNVAAAGDFVDISKYSNVEQVYKNEIARFKGFRVIENSNITINTDAGASAVDTYHSLFFGFNALGKATSEAPHMTVTGPFDKLGRIINLGWYGCVVYGIIDTDALWVVTSASTYGTN